MDEPTERLVDCDGGQLYVRDYPGRTPAIVAMHGFPDDSRIYNRLIGPLDPQRVVTFDWIGYGRSSRRDSRGSSARCLITTTSTLSMRRRSVRVARHPGRLWLSTRPQIRTDRI
jgi:YD repeat-containing protein